MIDYLRYRAKVNDWLWLIITLSACTTSGIVSGYLGQMVLRAETVGLRPIQSWLIYPGLAFGISYSIAMVGIYLMQGIDRILWRIFGFIATSIAIYFFTWLVIWWIAYTILFYHPPSIYLIPSSGAVPLLAFEGALGGCCGGFLLAFVMDLLSGNKHEYLFQTARIGSIAGIVFQYLLYLDLSGFPYDYNATSLFLWCLAFTIWQSAIGIMLTTKLLLERDARRTLAEASSVVISPLENKETNTTLISPPRARYAFLSEPLILAGTLIFETVLLTVTIFYIRIDFLSGSILTTGQTRCPTSPTGQATVIPSKFGSTTYPKFTQVQSMAFGRNGNLWTGGPSGVVEWHLDGTAINYTVDSGLANNNVNAVALAADGAMWFATDGGGVSRFDGQYWQTYTTTNGLANNYVTSIAVAPNGVVWFGTDGGGVSRFDGRCWTTYTVDYVSGNSPLINIVRDGNAKYARHATANGLASDTVRSIVVAPDGSVWFSGGGVSRFDGSRLKTYTIDDGLADNRVYSMAVAPDGALWFNTRSGLSRFDGKHWKTYTTVDGLVDNSARAIMVASNGVLWFGAGDPNSAPSGKGVSYFDGSIWKTYTTADGLIDNTVNSIAEAPDGTLWFGTDHGVSSYKPVK